MAGIQRFLSYQRVCAHTHTHVHMHTCAHACTHTCAHTYMRTCTRAHTITCTHAHACTHIRARVHAHTHMHTCARAPMHTCTHIHAHACTCMRAHAYTHTGTHTPGGLWRVPGASASAPQGSRGWPASVPSLPGEVAFTQWLVRAEASGHSHGLRVPRPPGCVCGVQTRLCRGPCPCVVCVCTHRHGAAHGGTSGSGRGLC